MQRRSILLFVSKINKLDYLERLQKLNLPALAYRRFHGSLIEPYKLLLNMYDANFSNPLFELKESNTCGHKFAIKIEWSRTSNRQNFLNLQMANLWNSLPENVVEAPTTDTFKNRFDRHCRERNLLFDFDIDYTNFYALHALLKSKEK